VPWIATSWEWIGEDQFRLFLREGVKFHNDEDLTSEDVAYTLRWITDPSNGSPTAIQLFWLGDVEIIDDYTVDLRTRPEFTPYAALVASLNVPVVPMDTVLAVGDEEFATNPVGSGPYLFSEWLYGDHVELKRNESYWGEHPYLETVLYREIREPTVMALELEAGSVDIAYSVPPSSVAFLSELPHLDVRSVPSLSCTQLHFNLESSIAQDIRFRQAVYRSVDWDAAVFSIFQDAQASRIYGCVPPILEADSSLALEDDVLYEDDGLAQQLFGELRAEGVLDEWRALRILTPMSEPMRTLSAILAASLEENGVPAEVVCVDEPAFLEYLRNRDPEEFEMILYEWSAGPDPHGFIYPLFHSDNAFEGSAANVSRTRDSELDWLIDHAGTSLDPTARESYYVEVQRLIHQRVYAIPILSAAATYITSERVHGFVGDALMDLWLATPLWRVFVEGDCN
jgi:peptide/nickel transport system substrate-binding protein